ncbi:FG-GAP-like repeat-containing protein [bacterium]
MKKSLIGIVFYTLCLWAPEISSAVSNDLASLIWKLSADLGVTSIAPTSDIDGDGIQDVFVGSADYLVYCLSGSGFRQGEIIWSWNLGAPIWTVVPISDINGDGADDCLVGCADNTIYCMSGNPIQGLSEILWSYSVDGDIFTIAVLNDLNGDGIDDCVMGTNDDQVCCLDGAYGLVLWTYRDPAAGAIKSVSAISDVNNDGLDDCLAGGENDKVLCLSGGSSGNGHLIWYCNTQSTILSVITIQDVDGDGKPDCLAGGEDDYITCLSGNASGKNDPVWTYRTGSTVKSVSSIADVNQDGIADCLAGSEDNNVYCVSGKTGQVLWSYTTPSTVLSVSSIADVNNNGIHDCIVGCESDLVCCIEGEQGTAIWSYETGGAVNCVVAVTDLNGNQIDDVLGGSTDSYVYALDGGYVETVSTPTVPTGPSEGKAGGIFEFTCTAVSNASHPLQYRFDWGDLTVSDWGNGSQSHMFKTTDEYIITAQARCQTDTNAVSDWSDGKDFIIQGHILDIKLIGSGEIIRSPNREAYNHDEVVTLTPLPTPGFRFDRWEGDVTGNSNSVLLNMTGDKSVTVYFIKTDKVVSIPQPPEGLLNGETGDPMVFVTGGSTSSLGHPVEYRFDWGNGVTSDWGDSSQSYFWETAGSFMVKSQARCVLDTTVLSAWSDHIIVEIEEKTLVYRQSTEDMPDHFCLFQNYPNPFNLKTTIEYQVPEACQVTIYIYNIQSNRIASIVDGFYQAGNYRTDWDGRTSSGAIMPSGFYFYCMKAGEFITVKEMLLLK